MPLKDIAMEPAADALGALLIEKDGVTLLNFSDQAVASKGAMVGYNTNTGTMGDLSFSYSAMSNKPNIIDQNGGYVGIAGNLPQPMPITGVAYVNDQVLTFDPTAGDYELSYTNVGSEGHALADGSREYFVKDHLGSTRLVLTEDFNNNPVKEAMDYLPYGTIINRGNVLQDAEQAREKFTGKEFDEELGMNLTYFGRRYYDPEIGVWTSTDPAEQYWNAYAYCDYDPLNFMDVDGMAGEELIEGVNVITVYGHAASSGLSLGSMLAGLNAMYQIYNMVQTFNQLQQMQQQINRMTFTGENNGVYWQDGNIVNENGIKDASGDLLAMAPIAAPIKGVQEGVKIAQAAKNEIQFAQKGISATFRHGEFAGKTIEDVGAGLRSGVVKPSQLPLQTITREGVTYTVNNRSLMALRMGDMAPTAVKDVTGNAFFERQLTQRLLEIGNAAGPNFVPFIR
jgi:RHS repeat-associated protein